MMISDHVISKNIIISAIAQLQTKCSTTYSLVLLPSNIIEYIRYSHTTHVIIVVNDIEGLHDETETCEYC